MINSGIIILEVTNDPRPQGYWTFLRPLDDAFAFAGDEFDGDTGQEWYDAKLPYLLAILCYRNYFDMRMRAQAFAMSAYLMYASRCVSPVLCQKVYRVFKEHTEALMQYLSEPKGYYYNRAVFTDLAGKLQTAKSVDDLYTALKLHFSGGIGWTTSDA